MNKDQTTTRDKDGVTVLTVWSFFILTALIVYKQFLLGFFPAFYLHLVEDLGLLILVLILSIKRDSRLLQNIQYTVAILLIIYNLMDICVILSLHQRFTLDNFIAHYRDVQEVSFFLTPQLIAFCVAVLVAFVLLLKRSITLPVERNILNLICYVSLFMVLIAYYFVNHVAEHTVSGSAIRVGSGSFMADSVTPSTLKMVQTNYPALIQRIQAYFNGNDWKQPIPQNVSKPNIIIDLSESLSAVDSKYSGGLFNRLPNIDKIQEQGLALTNAASNGKISDAGMAALFLGLHPIKTAGYVNVVDHFPPNKFFENNIITYANKAGYKTIFIGGAPRYWQHLTDWLKQVGFDEVYDNNSAIFANLARFTWNAASDEEMYKIVENLASQQSGPYLIVIENISLHDPYILPDPRYRLGSSDLLNLINYVDGTTYNFYQDLLREGFFNNGVLLVLGDHRRFEPLEKEEIETGGFARWHERIVAFLVGKNVVPHTKSNIPTNTSDLNYLLHYIIQGKVVDNDAILHSNLADHIGINAPFNISLANEFRGQYLIRSEKYPPLYVSIFGALPFNKIPYEAYKEATVFLIMNDQWTQEKLASTPTQ